MTMPSDEKRYQDCTWPVRLWRRRWYLVIPFTFLAYFYQYGSASFYITSETKRRHRFSLWSRAVCLAQGRMRWTLTTEEVFKDLI